MKVYYADIKIKIKAEEDEINGSNEMGLSDKVWFFQEKLEKWLEQEMKQEFPEFEFDVTGG